ncbi:dihydroneopterin aldolase [Sphingosinithalassobacter sp. LHW66-3]|uniref:dihydroneopterin aldolase n=1 Tax=Sphingosinithalassobacter sp. LHW66-3 TaxID=3424718 RepID=UPI003D6B76DB
MPDMAPTPAPGRYVTILEGLEVTMGLGIHAHERAAPQRVLLTVWLSCDYGARPDDRIDAVVDYDFLREGIHRLVAKGHIELQETLCEEVAALAFGDPRVTEVRVRSMKPDVYPDAAVGCEIVRGR